MSGLRHKQTFALAIFLLAVHGILLLLSMLGRGPGSGAVLGAAALLALVSGLALAALSQGMLARRLRTVARAARLAAAGNLDTRIEDSGNSELAELAAAFDRMRERLRLSTVSTSQLEKMLSSMSEALLVTCPEGKVIRANAAAGDMLGRRPDELIGRPMAELLQGADQARRSSGRGIPFESSFTRSDGTHLPVSYTVSELRDEQGRLEGRIYAVQNMSDRKRVEQRIRYLARTDPLTRMSNRMQFQHQLQQCIARARRRGQYLAVLYLDIDRFKDINDTFGHAAGDTSLEIFSRRVLAELDEQAVAGRLAGDEFAVLIEARDRIGGLMEELNAIASRLLGSIGRPFRIHGEEIYLTASAGVALYPRDGDNVIELLRNADAALYQAKRAGGNCVEFYSSDMNTAAVERLMLKGKLRRAFERNELTLYYQPKYGLRSARIEGVEALLRWDLPERGLVLPSDFIPLAEETNLILQIGDWVLNRVCEDYRQWQRTLPSPVRVSINLSLRQLQQQRFLERVQAVFRAHGVSPTCIELEITETTLMDDANRTVRILDALYAMGLHLAIDDFGTGYSSLSALQQFPIDTLKIDQSFVRDLPTDRDDAAIVATIIRMARSLKKDVVAEGVESEKQLEFLRRHGCDYVQGRLFGEPMTASEFLNLLVAQARGVAGQNHLSPKLGDHRSAGVY